MATGTLVTLQPVLMDGLSSRSTNYAAQCYVLDETPSRDVGYVAQEKRFSLFLWNGSAEDVTLTGISGNEATEGITWDVTPPDLIATGTSLRVNVTVGIDGVSCHIFIETFSCKKGKPSPQILKKKVVPCPPCS